MSPLSARISFTAIGGYEAEITGDEAAIRAIEEAFERAGIKFNEEICTWDEGFYDSTPGVAKLRKQAARR